MNISVWIIQKICKGNKISWKKKKEKTKKILLSFSLSSFWWCWMSWWGNDMMCVPETDALWLLPFTFTILHRPFYVLFSFHVRFLSYLCKQIVSCNSNFGYIFTTDCTDYTDFSSQEATMAGCGTIRMAGAAEAQKSV